MAYSEKLCPNCKRGAFTRLQVYKRVRISIVEVYERVRKSVSFRSVKGPKGLTEGFYGCEKVEKISLRVELPRIKLCMLRNSPPPFPAPTPRAQIFFNPDNVDYFLASNVHLFSIFGWDTPLFL